jgi:hypothetical protein
MALIKTRARQTTVERVAEGTETFVRGFRDGTLSMADLQTAMALEGRIFEAKAGTFTAPITFKAGAIVATTPTYEMRIPAGTTIIPLELNVQIESIGTALILEILATGGQGGSTTTAGTAIVPANLRSDAPVKSVCLCSHTTLTVVAPTKNYQEIWRTGEISAVNQTHSDTVSVYDHAHTYNWKAADAGAYTALVGASNLFFYISTQAGTGFFSIKWMELPSGAIV